MGNPEKLKLVKDHSLKSIAFAVARVPGTSRLFLGTSDFKVCEIDLAAAKPEAKDLYSHGSYVTGVALGDRMLATTGYDGKLTWYDIGSSKVVRTVDAHAKWGRGTFATRDGKLFASVADDMVCRLWEPGAEKPVRELKGHAEKTPNGFGSMLYCAAFSADGKLIATGDKVGIVKVWETATGKQVGEVKAPIMYTWDQVQRLHSIGGVRSVAFSPDGKTLAVGGTGKIGNIDHLEAKGRIELFDWAAGKQKAEFVSDRQGLVNHLEYGPDGSWLLAAGGAGEGFATIIDAAGKKAIKSEKVAMHVHDVVTTENAESFIAVGHNKLSVFEMKG